MMVPGVTPASQALRPTLYIWPRMVQGLRSDSGGCQSAGLDACMTFNALSSTLTFLHLEKYKQPDCLMGVEQSTEQTREDM